jgi:hypothetical protein
MEKVLGRQFASGARETPRKTLRESLRESPRQSSRESQNLSRLCDDVLAFLGYLFMHGFDNLSLGITIVP